MDDASPTVVRKRFAIAQRTQIERSRPGIFFYPVLAAIYLPLVVGRRIDVIVTACAFAVLLAFALARWSFYRRSTVDVDPDRWRRTFTGMASANIFTWDLFTAIELYSRRLDAACVALVVTSIALRASSAYAACADLRAHDVFSRWTRVPVIVALLALGTSAGVLLAGLVIMHMTYLYVNCKQLNEEFWRAIVNDEQRERAELELRLAQKLESVGRLAAGIAHEINTPLQAMMGNLEFLSEGVAELLAMAQPTPAQEADLAYLRENLPAALDITGECLQRTAAIVKSVKTFAHPELSKRTPVDINRAVQTTLDISRHEYAMVADVRTELGELPLVECYAGELNQALLNIVINAAHAIAARKAVTGARGTIQVTTRRTDDGVEIAIADTGGGIPEAIRERIFDPFFTTKGVGSGTGQGLAIARSVMRHHGGELDFESQVGHGTTFHLRLPMAGAQHAAEAVVS